MNEQEKQVLEKIVFNSVLEALKEREKPNKVILGVSNKHIHLTQEHVEALFGQGHELTKIKDLVQPGQFAAEECVQVVGPKGSFGKVRVLGPVRPESQVEISKTDARTLGIKAPVRESGKLEGTPGVKLVGPCGEVELDHGVIVAARHIHFSTEDAKKFGVVDKQLVGVKTTGERKVVFGDVICRVKDNFALEMHLDTDEANAAGVGNNEYLEIVENI